MSLKLFSEQVLACQQKLYRFALRMLGSVEEAEDVVQETLMVLWDKRQDLSKLANVEAWSMRVVKNRSLDRIKYRQKREYSQVEDINVAGEAPTPDRQAEVSDQMHFMQSIINQLPDNQKMIIQLREVEGYSYQEIAEMLELNLSQVKVYLFRARQKVREQLTKREAFGLNQSDGQ
ncbi:MAG: RNA polymerase sigma factor [Bacteroidota bacterium]